jgi:hypothetical protein
MTAVQAIRVAGVLVVTFIALGTFGLLAFLAGPQIEGALFPIIRAEHVAGSVRWTEKEICWSVHYVKYRNDAPAYFNYRLHLSGVNERIPLRGLPAGRWQAQIPIDLRLCQSQCGQ